MIKLLGLLPLAFLVVLAIGLTQEDIPLETKTWSRPGEDKTKHSIGYRWDRKEWVYQEDQHPPREGSDKAWVLTRGTYTTPLEQEIYDLEWEDLKQYMAD